MSADNWIHVKVNSEAGIPGRRVGDINNKQYYHGFNQMLTGNRYSS